MCAENALESFCRRSRPARGAGGGRASRGLVKGGSHSSRLLVLMGASGDPDAGRAERPAPGHERLDGRGSGARAACGELAVSFFGLLHFSKLRNRGYFIMSFCLVMIMTED